MTPRDRKLAVLLGVLVVFGGFGFGGYFGFYSPYQARKRQLVDLQDEITEKELALAKAAKARLKLQDTLKRSLPADLNDARHGYEAAIAQLLFDAKLPGGSYTVKAKPVDGRSAPELAPKRPAFTRIGLEITIRPVNYETLIDVLERYYRMNLLQQITKLTIKKSDGSSSSSRRSFTYDSKYTLIPDKPDLDVTILTEAIILDGAENRKSLFPIPHGVGGAAGGLGYTALYNSPEMTRGMQPLQLADVLATPSRDYSKLLMKDIFHGPPLKPDPKPKAKDPPKLPDTSQFIRLSAVSRNPDGTGLAIIEDIAGNIQYWVTLTRKNGGTLTAEISKHTFTAQGASNPAKSLPELTISERTSSTNRSFKVIGLDGNSLVLADRNGGDSGSATRVSLNDSGRDGPRSFGSRKSEIPAPRPKSAPLTSSIVGGVAVSGEKIAVVEEKVFVWHAGEALSTLKELSPAEAAQAIERATGSLPDPSRSQPTVPVTETKPGFGASADGDGEAG